MELLRLEEEREQFLHPRHGQPSSSKPGCGSQPSPIHTETA
jgi:hypothetical protein